jgi:hypothetical protein
MIGYGTQFHGDKNDDAAEKSNYLANLPVETVPSLAELR